MLGPRCSLLVPTCPRASGSTCVYLPAQLTHVPCLRRVRLGEGKGGPPFPVRHV